ncbi:MAG: hypothetical protein KF754_10295 [Planctomycetes bacterium]|nr:hypothetical protein [Planctomycetota bacterium]
MARFRGGYPQGVHIDLDGNTATELHADTKAWFRWLAAISMFPRLTPDAARLNTPDE